MKKGSKALAFARQVEIEKNLEDCRNCDRLESFSRDEEPA